MQQQEQEPAKDVPATQSQSQVQTHSDSNGFNSALEKRQAGDDQLPPQRTQEAPQMSAATQPSDSNPQAQSSSNAPYDIPEQNEQDVDDEFEQFAAQYGEEYDEEYDGTDLVEYAEEYEEEYVEFEETAADEFEQYEEYDGNSDFGGVEDIL